MDSVGSLEPVASGRCCSADSSPFARDTIEVLFEDLLPARQSIAPPHKLDYLNRWEWCPPSQKAQKRTHIKPRFIE